MTFLSLFTGVDGFDLALERAGMRCVGQVEIDPVCRSILARHFPEVARHNDARTTIVNGALSPRWLLLKDVLGLLNSNKGEDFQVVLAKLDEFRSAPAPGPSTAARPKPT